MISAAELQKALREFGGPMGTITVAQKSVLAEHIVVIEGAASINGQPFWFETDFNLREIGGPEHIVRLAGMLLKSFQKADKGLSA